MVFFNLQLIMFFEGLRSERRLIDTASLHLAHRWYLSYGLDELLPDHYSLTRIRQRLGLPIFQHFFEHVVDLCQQGGLLWGRELFFDATKVRANAALNSVVPRFYLQAKTQAKEHLAELFAGDSESAAGEAVAPGPASPEENGAAAAPVSLSPIQLPTMWVEPLFGEAKQWHGLRQFRLRGLGNVNMEALLVATGQNLKQWLAKTGWGRRHGPQGSLLARPTCSIASMNGAV